MWVPWEATHQLQSKPLAAYTELILGRGQTDKDLPLCPLPNNHSSKSVRVMPRWSHVYIHGLIWKKSKKSQWFIHIDVTSDLIDDLIKLIGVVAEWVRVLAWTDDRTVPAGFESHCGKLRFGTLEIPFTPVCQCLSEETLKAVGPFYLVSMPGQVKYPTSPHWNV